MEKKKIIVVKTVDGRTVFVIDILSSSIIGERPIQVKFGRKEQATSNRKVFSKLLPYVNSYKYLSFHLVDFQQVGDIYLSALDAQDLMYEQESIRLHQ